MYRPKLSGKPLVLDVSVLLKKIQDAIQALFRTYPAMTGGATGIVARGTGAGVANVLDLQKSERQAKLRAESWKAASTQTVLRNSIR